MASHSVGAHAVLVPSDAPGAPGRLENYADNAAPPLTSDDARSRRYRLREALWRLSSLERVRKCGRVRRGDLVGVRYGEAGAGFSGLCSCGSPWADPVCNAKIMYRRFLDLGVGLARHYAAGGSVLFMTRTIRHHRGEALTDLWRDVLLSWRSMTGSAAWKRAVQRLGVIGHVRVVEVTDGENGWHVHIHALLLTASPLSEDALSDFSTWSTTAWSRAVVRRGRPAPLAAGQDVRQMATVGDALARYVTKMALEITSTQTKTASGAHRTRPVWSLLSDAAVGDADALDRWHQWEAGSKDRRQMTWSRGLRTRLGLGRELADEEITTEDVGDLDLLWITAEGWDVVVTSPGLQGQILAAADAGGDELRALLLDHGVAWVENHGAEVTAEAVAVARAAHPERVTGQDFRAQQRARDRAARLAVVRSTSRLRPTPTTWPDEPPLEEDR